jgi:hypothetical protein
LQDELDTTLLTTINNNSDFEDSMYMLQPIMGLSTRGVDQDDLNRLKRKPMCRRAMATLNHFQYASKICSAKTSTAY